MHSDEALRQQLDRYYYLFRELTFLYEEWSKSHGMSYNNLMILSAIYEHQGDCTQKTLRDKWFLPKQTINSILKDFERKGLIQLVQSPDDKRNKFIQLTKPGKQQAEKVVPALRTLELNVLKAMGHEQVECFNDDMACFISLFQKGVGEHNE